MSPATFALWVFALVATCQVEAAAPNWRQVYDDTKIKCAKETGVTPDHVKILDNHSEIPKDDGERCFMECVYKSTGLVTGGKFSEEGFGKLVDAKFTGEENKRGKEVTKHCSAHVAAKEGEKCSLGRSVRECLVSQLHKFNLFPES